MTNNYCPECDRDFKSITGLNGHNQFKHNKLPESIVTNNPAGRTTAMLELMKDQMEGLKLEIQGLREDLEDGIENGNENGNPVLQQKFACEYCRDNNRKIQYLSPNQEQCPGCRKPITWEIALV
jgi:hypothetical protein